MKLKNILISLCLLAIVGLILFLFSPTCDPSSIGYLPGSVCNKYIAKWQSYLYKIKKIPPNKNLNYEKGFIIISFQEGTTYKEAKDLLQNLGLNLENTNGYWKSINFVPHENTILKKIDIFKIMVPNGDEDKFINLIKKYSIINNAAKNYVTAL